MECSFLLCNRYLFHFKTVISAHIEESVLKEASLIGGGAPKLGFDKLS